MSIKVITAVLDLPPAVVSPPERLVLIALAWHADEHGLNAWPAVGTICRKTSLGRRTVQMVLPRLKQKGLVYVQSVAARGSVRYAVDLQALDCARHAQSGPVNCAPDTQSGPDDCAPDARGGAPDAPPLRTTCTGGAHDVRPIRPLTVLESSLKKNPGAARRNVAVENDDEKNGDAGAVPAAARRNDIDEGHERQRDDQERLRARERVEALAHATFDALGDHAPFEALAEDFCRRADGIEFVTPYLKDLGLLLFSIQKQRIARRSQPSRQWPQGA